MKTINNTHASTTIEEWSDLHMTQKLVKDSFGLRLITTRLVSGRYVDTARRITQAQAARWALRRLMSRKMAGIVKAACPA